MNNNVIHDDASYNNTSRSPSPPVPYYSGFPADDDGVEVIDLLSNDAESDHTINDDNEDDDEINRNRSSSPTHTGVSTTSSFEIVATVEGGSPSPFITLMNENTDPKPEPQDVKPRSPRKPRSNTIRGPRLTEVEQASIVNFREAGWTQRRIAEYLDRPENTISTFLTRRKAKIQQMMATLPGGRYVGAARMAPVKRENTAGNGRQGGARRAVKRERSERSNAPDFSWAGSEVDDKQDIKRVKREKAI